MKNRTEIVKKFRSSIRCGTGGAYILMTKYSEINFTNEIHKACKVNFAYDVQSEGDRSDYLIQFIEKLSIKQKLIIKQKLLQSLIKEKKDTWNLKQIFNVLAHFGNNDIKVKKAIYKKFKQCPIEDSHWLGEEAIVKMDGQKGMLFLSEHYGKCLTEDSESWYNDYLVNNYDEENPKENIKKILLKASINNRYIKAYVKEIKRTRANWDKQLSKRTKWTFNKVVTHLTDDKLRRPMYFAIEKLSKKELKEISKLLNENSSEKTKSKVLSLFTIVKCPANKSLLKQYLNKRYSSSIRDYAYEALSFFPDNEIRRKAIEKLKTTIDPRKHLELQKSNYKEGDSKLILKTVNRFKDEHKIEEIAISLCEVYENNSTKECKKPLLALYLKMNCAIHRNSVLNLLHNNDVLPKSVLAEMKYDCDEDTRKLFHKIQRKAGNIR